MTKRSTSLIRFSLLTPIFVLAISCTNTVEYNVVEEKRVEKLLIEEPNGPECQTYIKMPFISTEGNEKQKELATKINNQVLMEFFYAEGNPQEVMSTFIDNYIAEYRNERLEDYTIERSICEDEDTSFLVSAFSANLTIEGTVSTGRDGVIAYTVLQDIYNGGAHPVTTTHFMNFNPVTGNELKMADIFISGSIDTLTNRIANAIASDKGVNTIEELQEMGYDNITTPQEFLIGQDSITFYYNVYEIAPYALGPTKVSISLQDLNDIMVKDVLAK